MLKLQIIVGQQMIRKKHLKRQKNEQRIASAKHAEEQKQRNRAMLVRDTPVREEFLKKLAKNPRQDQLWQLANDTSYPVSFYPTCLANCSQDELLALDKDLIKALRRKMETKCRGPWTKFKKRFNALII